MRENNVWKHVIAVSAGVIAGLSAATVCAAVVGLKLWAKDEDSDTIRIACGKKGIMIRKNTETGKYEVDTNYDWSSDPEFCADDEGCSCCEDDLNCHCVEVKTEKKEDAGDTATVD